MKFSIVIPAYNAAKYLGPTLKSVQAQTQAGWELVVVNDGSTDGTEALACDFAAQDSRIRVISQPNGGLAAARNRGLCEIAPDSEMIAFLDADDLWEPETLACLCAALQDRPAVVAAHGTARFIDSDGQLWEQSDARELTRRRQRVAQGKLRDCPLDQPTTFEVLAYRNVLWTAGQLLIRRSAMEQAGRFDGAMSGTADWDMWIRLALLGGIAFVDKPLVRYRRHESNMSSKEKLMRRDEIAMRRKHLASPQLSAEQRTTMLQGYRLFERHYGGLKWRLACQNWKQGRVIMASKLTVHAALRLMRSLPVGQP